MKHLQMLGLAVLAAGAMAALAASASATTLTSPTGTAYTGEIHMKSHSSMMIFHGESLRVECKRSTLSGEIMAHGSSVTASGPITAFSLGECNYAITVLKAGSLEVHTDANGNGTLTWTGAELTYHGPFGINCIYRTSGTHIGTLTDSHTTGGHATLDIDSSLIPREGHSAFCGSYWEWTGSYTLTTPSRLYMD